jgi:hypothetical protein
MRQQQGPPNGASENEQRQPDNTKSARHCSKPPLVHNGSVRTMQNISNLKYQSHSEDGAQIQCERGNFDYGHPEQRDSA